LRLRLTVAIDLGRHPGLEWVRVRGIELRRDGIERGQRDVLVRVSALGRYLK